MTIKRLLTNKALTDGDRRVVTRSDGATVTMQSRFFGMWPAETLMVGVIIGFLSLGPLGALVPFPVPSVAWVASVLIMALGGVGVYEAHVLDTIPAGTRGVWVTRVDSGAVDA